MKTAISLPDHLFRMGERLADALGVSRSQLYQKALLELIEGRHAWVIREQRDAAHKGERRHPDLEELNPAISAPDDDPFERAARLTGVTDRRLLIRLALEALIARESARRLSELGGSEPDLHETPRRRPDRS
jgi:hypothetical protein